MINPVPNLVKVQPKGFTLIRTLLRKDLVRIHPAKGFTLIELLVVIAIIGVLAAVVMLAINPLEMQRRGRDSTRMSDLVKVKRAIDMSINDGTTILSMGLRNSVNQSRESDNTPQNYLNMNVSSYLSTLPIDPINDNDTTLRACINPATVPNSPGWRYRFSANGSVYELSTWLESGNSCTKAQNDGGNSPYNFEVGTAPGLTLIGG